MGTGASIALIALALAVVGFMQTAWFMRSAETDLDEAHRSIFFTVTQTISREYQRYAPVMAVLDELADGGAKGATDATPAEARAALERLYALYGPTGSSPALVSGVGLAGVGLGDGTGQAVRQTLGADGSWAGAEGAPALAASEAARAALDKGKPVLYSGEGGSQYLLCRAGPSAIAVVETDAAAFWNAYVGPALAEALPGAAISWTDAAGAVVDASTGEASDTTSASDGRSAKVRSDFNPLLVLLRIGDARLRTFSMPVPASMDAYLSRGPGFFEGDDDRDGGPAGFRAFRGADPRAPRDSSGDRSVSIVMPEDSAVARMALRLSMNWLLSMLFLAGIGLAFAQTLAQKHKQKAVSEREREFVASVTHELRTPVTAMRTASDNMRKGLVGPERMAAYGEMIHAQSLRLGSMIEEMLLFAQVEGRGKPAPALAVIDAAKLLAGIREPLDEIAAAAGVRVSWDWNALPGSFVGDAEAIGVIVGNLVANALYHAYTGREKGEVRVIGRISQPSTLQFIVEDDGRGIAKAESRLVFEPFYRDDESRSRHEKGSGLGLFIARRTARMQGGELSFESPYQRIDGSRRPGCRFRLELPAGKETDVR